MCATSDRDLMRAIAATMQHLTPIVATLRITREIGKVDTSGSRGSSVVVVAIVVVVVVVVVGVVV